MDDEDLELKDDMVRSEDKIDASIATRFQPGNNIWEARSTHGRHKIFESPEILWDGCVQYFQWVKDNPLEEEKVFHYQGDIVRTTIHKMRAMTISGLCLFLEVGEETFRDYRNRPEFSGVANKAVEIIYNQKFAGAAADLMNANIIARDLGLKDHQQQDLNATGTLGELLRREINSPGFEEDSDEIDQ